MSNNTQSGDGGDDGTLWWSLLKMAIFVIGAIVLLRFVFGIMWALLPFIVVAALAYLVYKIFLQSDDSGTVEAQEDPLLIEHQEVILDDEDPLEKKFREFEASQSHVDADR